MEVVVKVKLYLLLKYIYLGHWIRYSVGKAKDHF